MKNSIKAAFAAIALVASALVPTVGAQALSVPKTTWPVCSSTRTSYCIESVSVSTPGGSPIDLAWVASGSDAPTGTNTATPPTPSVTAALGSVAQQGRWTSGDWAASGLAVFGYDGLLIDAKAANSFTNHLFIDVRPIKIDGSKNAYVATQSAKPTYATALDPDVSVTAKIRIGEVIPGVTMAVSTGETVTKGSDANGNWITISGNPTPVAIAAKSSDCTGEAGVAAADSSQIQLFVLSENDGMGFGVDGLSGKMAISSNGSCGLSTPVWDNNSKSMTWSAAAPHFAADGTTVNMGFYRAVIPANDAKLLWGLNNPNDAASALTVSVSNEAGGAVASVTKVAVRNGNIIIDSTGFHYSKPNFKITKNAKYKAKPFTITCVKGKTTKKVTGTLPKCPSGYKQK
jgi:hypothetical protein